MCWDSDCSHGLLAWFSLTERWVTSLITCDENSDCHMGLVAWSSLAERWISQTYLLRVGVNLLAIYFTGNCYEGEEIDHEFWLTNNISKIHFTNFRSLLNIFAIVQAQVRKAGRCLWGHRYKDRRGGLRWQLGQCWGWRWDQCFDRNESDLWKRFILLLIPHNGWQKSFSGAKIQLLSPVAVCPALSGVWSGLAACGPAGVLHAVRAVIMCGLYSARRGEGEVVVSQPGKWVIYK